MAQVHVLLLHAGAWGEHRMTPIFVYESPEASPVAPGLLVLVPFGPRLLNGIIWDPTPGAAGDTYQGDAIRAIHAVLDAEPMLDGAHRALARWMADYYLCSLPEVVRLMLPGLTSTPRIELRPGIDTAQDGEATTDAESQALLALVQKRGYADEQMVRRALGTKRTGALIARLEARGALTRTAHTTRSHTSPGPVLRLNASTATVDAWRTAQLQRLSPVHSTARHPALKPRRGRGALLRAIAQAGTEPAPNRGAGSALSPRAAAQLLGALAIVDLLCSSPENARPQREVLRLTRATPAALAIAIAAGLVILVDPPPEHGPPPASLTALAHRLNSAQAAALAAIVEAMDHASEMQLLAARGAMVDDSIVHAARPLLLFGVTGSGKTEVYLQAMEQALARGRRGIVLVPEIALTPQAVGRFASRFPGRVALLHSGLKPAERRREWLRIRAGLVDVVIGSRSAIFAPLPDLGLIILDEEHEGSYKQDERPPTYHAREVACTLGRLTGAAIVFGSATPATETYHRALHDEFALLELPERATASVLPAVDIVDLRAELRAGHTSILSRELLEALHQTLARGEQAILYLNRSGSATCVICRECGYVMRCPRCDVPLTHHQQQRQLICHYCNWREAPPLVCGQCGGVEIRYFGIGTERVEATVRELFPTARVMRWDNDTVHSHTDHERFARALAEHQTDILIGTQMIAKGLDVPAVTLVGIIAADVALFLPDYRAQERAFQLLTQVAGRAGRSEAPGRVILQSFSPDHLCIEAAARHDYKAFYAMEIAARISYGYPPLRRFIKLTYTHRERYACQIEALTMGERINELIADLAVPDTDVVGPAPAFMERLREQYRWQMILRGPDPRVVIAGLAPNALGPGWSINIDPLSSL